MVLRRQSLDVFVVVNVRDWALSTNYALSNRCYCKEQCAPLASRKMEEMQKLSAWTVQVAAVTLVAEQFSVENNLLTPTFKLKRPQAKAAFQEAIDKMYAKTATSSH